jgi:hypothetical protein
MADVLTLDSTGVIVLKSTKMTLTIIHRRARNTLFTTEALKLFGVHFPPVLPPYFWFHPVLKISFHFQLHFHLNVIKICRDGKLHNSIVNHHQIELKTMNKPAAMSSEDGIGKCGSIQTGFGGI